MLVLNCVTKGDIVSLLVNKILVKLSGEAGYLDREEFIEYARKSGSIRELTDRISSSGKSVGTSVNKPKVSLDKAELAFKVRPAEIRRYYYYRG